MFRQAVIVQPREQRGPRPGHAAIRCDLVAGSIRPAHSAAARLRCTLRPALGFGPTWVVATEQSSATPIASKLISPQPEKLVLSRFITEFLGTDGTDRKLFIGSKARRSLTPRPANTADQQRAKHRRNPRRTPAPVRLALAPRKRSLAQHRRGSAGRLSTAGHRNRDLPENRQEKLRTGQESPKVGRDRETCGIPCQGKDANAEGKGVGKCARRGPAAGLGQSRQLARVKSQESNVERRMPGRSLA